MPALLAQAHGVGSERGRSWSSTQQEGARSAWPLGPGSDFRTVSRLLFAAVTEQVPLIWRLEAKSTIKPLFTESLLCARHSPKDFASIISFNLNSSKSPVR